LIDCDRRDDCERAARDFDLRAVRPEHCATRGAYARRRGLRVACTALVIVAVSTAARGEAECEPDHNAANDPLKLSDDPRTVHMHLT
jgi:hypothetical protein